MRKAQITVYIILGIIILFSIATAVYVAHRIFVSPAAAAYVDKPVKDYVESCIQQVGQDALVKIGASGGYLDISDPEFGIFVSKDPAEGDALPVSGIAGSAVPYWFYMSTENTCSQCRMESLQPSLGLVKQQIDFYVDENLESCLNGFEPFLRQGYIFETGDVKSDVLLAEESTIFIVKYPVAAKNLDVTSRMEDFSGVVDVSFKKMYDLGGRIVKEEREKAFLESILFHVISLHTGLDMSRLPPLAGITHDKILVSWLKPVVEMNLQQLMLSYFPLVQLHNTKGAKPVLSGDNAFEAGFYRALYLRFLEEEYPFSVNFMYFGWPFYFDITPRSGDILTGEVHVQEFPFNFAPAFQTNYYEFYYDVSAPLLVEVRDDDALGGKGFSLNFALELNVRDNKDFAAWNRGEGTVGFWDPANAGVEKKEIKTAPGACAAQGDSWKCDITGKVYSGQVQCSQNCFVSESRIVAFEPVKKLFADSGQEVSDTIILSAFDAVTKAGISDVSVLFACGKYKAKAVGGTGLDGRLRVKMPLCINGLLSFEKEGYAKKIIPFTVLPGDRKNVEVVLEPEAVVDVVILKHPVQIRNLRELEYSKEPEPKLSTSYADFGSWDSFGSSALAGFSEQVLFPLKLSLKWKEDGYKVGRAQKNMKIYDRYCCDVPQELGSGQQAVLMVEKIPEDIFEPAYFQVLMLDSVQAKGRISLVPGLYKVTGMLIDSDGFVIEPGCQEICIEYDLDAGYYAESAVKGMSDVLDLMPDEKPACRKWGYFPETSIEAKPSLMGGVILDNRTGYWNVTRSGLGKGSVEFYFIQSLKPTCTVVQDCVLDVCVDIAEVQAAGPYSLKYREYLEPKFISR